jgi:uncharacterized protein
MPLMLVTVRVIPKASRNEVIEEPGLLKVRLTRPAQDGEANEQLRRILAEHFRTKKYLITIRKGHTSRTKIIEIATG